MSEAQSFWDQIASTPDDWTTYLAFADWLRENGRGDLGYALEWSGRRGHRPKIETRRIYSFDLVTRTSSPQLRTEFIWSARGPRGGGGKKCPWQLPWVVFNALCQLRSGFERRQRFFDMERSFFFVSQSLSKLRTALSLES